MTSSARGHGEGGHVRVVHVAIEPGNEFGVADRVADVVLELGGERGHPADDDGGLDPVVERGEVAGAHAADGEADAADPVRVHLGPRDEVVHRPHVVPEHHARPGEARGVDGPADELLRSGRRAG